MRIDGRRLAAEIDLTELEILEDLCWPGPPPGRWLDVPAPPIGRVEVSPPTGSRKRPLPSTH